MNFGANPVDCEGDKPHADLGIEPLDRLHEANVAFLDQVAERKSVTGIASGDVHDEPQVGEYQALGRFQVIVLVKPRGEIELLLLAEHGHCPDGLDVLVQAADGTAEHQLVVGDRCGHDGWPPVEMTRQNRAKSLPRLRDFSTLAIRVLTLFMVPGRQKYNRNQPVRDQLGSISRRCRATAIPAPAQPRNPPTPSNQAVSARLRPARR